MSTTTTRHHLVAKNVREPASTSDGARILVDRLWPRGVSRTKAALTAWERELAPSDDLRRWFNHDPRRWDGFRRRYWHELEVSGRLEALRELGERTRHENVTLVYGASDHEHNNAVALLEFAGRL